MQRLDSSQTAATPKIAGSSPAALLKEVDAVIRNHPGIDAFGLSINVDGDSVLLAGTVGSYSERIIAQELAQGVPGVGKVVNGIQVRPFGTDWAIRDDQIASAIAKALATLANRADVSGVTYGVFCHVVTLKGSATSASDRALIRHAVETLPGVDFVDNHIALLS